MLSSNFIEISEVFLDYTGKKKENYIIVFNKLKIHLNLKVNDKEFLLLSSEGTLQIPFSDYYFNLKIFDNKNLLQENLDIPFHKWKINGIGENSFIETKVGKIKISDLNKTHSIYNPNLNCEKYITKIKFKITKLKDLKQEDSEYDNLKMINLTYPIKIKKNSCGINIPYNDTIVSINNSVKIKKIIIKGRQLFLNRKGVKEQNCEYIYNLITKNNNHYLSNGFIFDSYLPF